VRVGLGVDLGVGLRVSLGVRVGSGPSPVHVDVLVIALLGPVRHMSIELALEEILPPFVGLIAASALALLGISLGKKIFEEGVLLRVDFFLLEQVAQPLLVVFLLE